MLWQRILSAIIGIPVAIYIFYLGGIPFFISIIILNIIGQREIMRIIANTGVSLVKPLIYLSGIIFGVTAYYLVPAYFPISLITSVLLLFFIFVINFPAITLKDLQANLFVMMYPGLLFSQLILLRNLSSDGFIYIVLLFLITWSSDTFAYFVGRIFGKNKLATLISPAKTVEGAIGGIFGATLIVAVFNNYFVLFPFAWAVLLGIAGSIIAQLGDLFESALKRLGNIKDSGNLIPGHGGILDRFDSVLFLGPALYYLLLWIP